MDADDESSDNEDTSFQVDDDEMFYDTPASRRQITTMCKSGQYFCLKSEKKPWLQWLATCTVRWVSKYNFLLLCWLLQSLIIVTLSLLQ